MSRYSQLYIDRGLRTTDSEKARSRLAAWLDGLDYPFWGAIYQAVMREIGAPRMRPNSSPDQYNRAIDRFVRTSELPDFLDSITIIFSALNLGSRTEYVAHDWKNFARRVFLEEHLDYTIDDSCIVHSFVDQEFEVNRAAALDALGEAKFGETRRDFEAAFKYLRDGEGKAAIRSMFPAVETAAKILCPGAFARLMPNEVDQHFVLRLQQVYAGNQPAMDAGKQLFQGMKACFGAAISARTRDRGPLGTANGVRHRIPQRWRPFICAG